MEQVDLQHYRNAATGTAAGCSLHDSHNVICVPLTAFFGPTGIVYPFSPFFFLASGLLGSAPVPTLQQQQQLGAAAAFGFGGSTFACESSGSCNPLTAVQLVAHTVAAAGAAAPADGLQPKTAALHNISHYHRHAAGAGFYLSDNSSRSSLESSSGTVRGALKRPDHHHAHHQPPTCLDSRLVAPSAASEEMGSDGSTASDAVICAEKPELMLERVASYQMLPLQAVTPTASLDVQPAAVPANEEAPAAGRCKKAAATAAPRKVGLQASCGRVALEALCGDGAIAWVDARRYGAILRRRQQRNKQAPLGVNVSPHGHKPFLHAAWKIHALRRVRSTGDSARTADSGRASASLDTATTATSDTAAAANTVAGTPVADNVAGRLMSWPTAEVYVAVGAVHPATAAAGSAATAADVHAVMDAAATRAALEAELAAVLAEDTVVVEDGSGADGDGASSGLPKDGADDTATMAFDGGASDSPGGGLAAAAAVAVCEALAIPRPLLQQVLGEEMYDDLLPATAWMCVDRVEVCGPVSEAPGLHVEMDEAAAAAV